MRQLQYEPCQADPDIWYKAMTRPENGYLYYAYMLLYVDDILAVHHDDVGAIKVIIKFFKMKKNSIGDPDIYLGAKLRKVTLQNNVVAWSLSPSKYVQETVKNVKDHFKRERAGLLWPKKAVTPFIRNYLPEMDITKELDLENSNYFQSQIGILRWMVELGGIDIITELLMLVSFLASP